jgi:hypothetical protein
MPRAGFELRDPSNQTYALDHAVAAETSSSEAGSWREMSLNLADTVSLSHYARDFNTQ